MTNYACSCGYYFMRVLSHRSIRGGIHGKQEQENPKDNEADI